MNSLNGGFTSTPENSDDTGVVERLIKSNDPLDIDRARVASAIQEQYIDNVKGFSLHKVDSFPNIRDYSHRVSWGVFQWTIHDQKTKLLRAANAISLDGSPNVMSPSQLARLYLATVYSDRRLKAHTAQVKSISQWRPMPLFLQPKVFPEGCYVDTSSAWFSILKLVGWDVDYDPSRWLLGGRPPFDFPLPDNKIARNCIVTASLPTPSKEWTGSRFREVSMQNKFVNLGLWSLIADILHALAFEAIECGACYVHTDGYIVPRNRASELAERIESYGLKTKIKHEGMTVVMGWSNWKVGKHESANWGAYTSTVFSNLRYVDREWLKKRLQVARKSQIDKWAITW